MTETGKLFLKMLPSIVLPMFLAVVDQTIVAAALPAIAADLGGIERVSWVVVAYLVATTIAAPVYGQLRDIAGGRRMMFIGLAVFISASLLCAVSTSIEMLIAARVLQGFGGGGLMTLSQALIGETIPPRERGRFQGYLAAVVVTSSTFGPVAGGYLTEHFGWRSVFLVNLPVGLLAFLLTMRLKTIVPNVKGWSFDWIGLGLFVTFIAPVLLAVSQAHQMTASSLVTFCILFGIGLVSLVLLLRHERHERFPLIPIALLRQPVIWRSDALAACHGAMLVSLVTFLPLYFRVVRGLSAGETGLLLLPLVVSIGVGSVITGRLVSKTGYTTIFPSIGLIFVVALLFFLAFGASDLTTRQLAALFCAQGVFMGTVMGVVQVTVQRAAGSASLGQASASVQLSRSVGAAFGTAIVGLVLFASISYMDREAADMFRQIVDQGPSILGSLPHDRQSAISAEIASAFRAAFATIAVFGCLALPLAWSIPMRRI
jgi:EmrB/QacA subfamily drug resistance transporter